MQKTVCATFPRAHEFQQKTIVQPLTRLCNSVQLHQLSKSFTMNYSIDNKLKPVLLQRSK